jgi:N,N'-diacetyllegionaminate synthase
LGNGIKKPTDVEKDTRIVVRKSIVAKVEIPAATVITKAMLDTKGPATGIEPKYIDKIVGRKAAVDIKKDEEVRWEKLQSVN